MPSDSSKIEVACACGARMAAPRAFIGRRARCKQCGEKIEIQEMTSASPVAASRTSNDPATDSVTSADSDKITVACACGKRFAAKRGLIGKQARCKACNATLTIQPEDDRAEGTAADDSDLFASSALFSELAASESSSDGILDLAPEEAPLHTPRYATTATQAVVTKPSRVCPGCKQQLAPGHVMCLDCGIDTRTGRAPLLVDDSHLDAVYDTSESIIRGLSFFMWLGWLPIASEAFGTTKPYAARGIFILTTLVTFWYFFHTWDDPYKSNQLLLWGGSADVELEMPTVESVSEDFGWDPQNLRPHEQMIVQSVVSEAQYMIHEQAANSKSFHSYQLLTHTLLHADFWHWAGNMLLFLVFGAGVNAAVGNWWTLVIYPIFGIVAGLAHLSTLAGGPPMAMLGASGAVMGMAGIYLVLFPVHKVHMAVWLRMGLFMRFKLFMKIFSVRGFWVVLFYIGGDVLYVYMNWNDNVAHWAHLGGFIAGMVVGLGLLLTRLVHTNGNDMLSLVFGAKVTRWLRGAKPVAA